MSKKLGPWKVESVVAGPPEREGFQIMDGDDVLVELFEGNGWNQTQIEKILKLMAAAPELVCVLEQAEKEIRRLHMLHTPYFEGKVGEPRLSIAEKARKIINKAKGE